MDRAYLTIDLQETFAISIVQIFSAECYGGDTCDAKLNIDQDSCICEFSGNLSYIVH